MRSLAAAAALGLLVLLAAAPLTAAARPGGGNSYSGGSHSSSSSYHSSGSSYHSSGSSYRGGGSVGDPGVFQLVIIAILVAGIIRALTVTTQARTQHWDSDDTDPQDPSPAPHPAAHVVDLGDIRELDPDFSTVLFEDFVYALYARAQQARSDPDAMAALAPYIAAETRAALLHRDPAGVPIHGVVIGAMRPLRVELARPGKTTILVELEFEANYSAAREHGPQGYFIRERWTLVREAGVHTRAPADLLALGCPACGAPFRGTDDGRCAHCGQQVDEGRFDWTLTHVRAINQEWRPPALTADVAEVGTDLPTVAARDLRARLTTFAAVDPGATVEHIERRVRAIFTALNAAWTARDLGPARPYVSDSLFNYLSYWIVAYRAQGLRNVLRDMSIARIEFAKLTRDRHYDAVTVRVYASGYDSTVRVADGRRVSGSDSHPRSYSEYWTLIRGAGVHGAAHDPATCPRCGAALDRINMAGHCEYCGTHLTRGEFDWVLGKIEQDEAYTG
jgi:hypothetical protein